MSTCDDIINKLNSIDSKIDSFRSEFDAFQVDLGNALFPFIDEVKVNQQFIVDTMGEFLKPMNDEQLLQSEALKTIGLSLSNLDSISSKNNLFLQKISKFKIYSNDFLTQIANIEAVSKELNKVYLGGNDGT